MVLDGDRHWHMDKRVSISHILTTLVLLAGLLSWSVDMEKRLASLANEVSYLKEAQQNRSEAVTRELGYIRQSLEKLNDKLDHIYRQK